MVSDNGIGIPDSIDLQGVDSLGLKLIKSLTENQLKGKFEFVRNRGTKFLVTFQLDI